jgi:scyllo-inositol 2-dehydrogenase (NADP+)
MEAGQVRVGLIGYGLSGATFHAPLIKAIKGLRLTRVCSANADKVLCDFPGMHIVAEPAALIESDEVDLVVVATPNTTHYSLARQALLANKHVVVEKPFTVTFEEGAALVALADERKLLLSVYHNRRWDNDFQTVRNVIESGLLGPVKTYEAHFDRYRPVVRQRWREADLPGSGGLYDLGSHLIDQALLLFGNPDSVSCDMGIQREGGLADDYFHLTMRYGARRVILHSASIVRQPGPRFTVHGDLGTLTKHGLDPQEAALLRGEGPASAGWGIEALELRANLTFDKGPVSVSGQVDTVAGCYQAYYQGMFDAIANGKALPVSAREGLAVIKIIQMAIRSQAEQRAIAFE